MAVAHGIAFATAGPANRVVIGNGGGEHAGHRVCLVREQYGAGTQEYVALVRHRVLGAVALGVIVGVVHQEIDRLVPLEIDDLEDMSLGESVCPGRTCGDHVVHQDAAGKPFELGIDHGNLTGGNTLRR